MKPHIDSTSFGSIKIAGKKYDHDVVIRLDGSLVKRRKKLSKKVTGSGHVLSRDEAEFVFEPGAGHVVIGTGQSGMLVLSDEAAAYFRAKGCRTDLAKTRDAVKTWNSLKGSGVGLFHITC